MPQSSSVIHRVVAILGTLGMLLVAALAGGGVPLPTARAEVGSAQFGLQPVFYDPSESATKSYFVFDGMPGAAIESRVRVINTGTTSGTVRLYPVDATTGATSGVVFRTQQDPRQDVGQWITLDTQELTLDPGESQVVAFDVAVPAASWSGQHVGGIVAENEQEQSGDPSSAVHISVRNLTIVAVQVNVAGPAVAALTATDIQLSEQNGSQALVVGLNNTGAVMLKPSGTLSVTDAQGQLLRSMPLQLDTILPHTSIAYRIAIEQPALPPGDYSAALSLDYDQGQTLAYTAAFAVPQGADAPAARATSPVRKPAAAAMPAGTILIITLAIGSLILLVVLTRLILGAASVASPASPARSRRSARRPAALPEAQQPATRLRGTLDPMAVQWSQRHTPRSSGPLAASMRPPQTPYRANATRSRANLPTLDGPPDDDYAAPASRGAGERTPR